MVFAVCSKRNYTQLLFRCSKVTEIQWKNFWKISFNLRDENELRFFQQGIGTAHMASNKVVALNNIFVALIIGHSLWPTHSHGPVLYDYYFYGCFSDCSLKTARARAHTHARTHTRGGDLRGLSGSHWLQCRQQLQALCNNGFHQVLRIL